MDIIELHRKLSHCGDFILRRWTLLLPGPMEVGTGSVLPFRQLPDAFTKDLKRRVPKLQVASNPCRLRFFTQEILVFKEDLLKKIQKHALPVRMLVGNEDQSATSDSVAMQEEDSMGVLRDGGSTESRPPSRQAKPIESLARLVVDQGHLFPLPPAARPVVWDLDYTLQMYPLPHLVSSPHPRFTHLLSCDFLDIRVPVRPSS